jgi:hypothetical protein
MPQYPQSAYQRRKRDEANISRHGISLDFTYRLPKRRRQQMRVWVGREFKFVSVLGGPGCKRNATYRRARGDRPAGVEKDAAPHC